MKKMASAFVIGFTFALGLGISQMTSPEKILGFLNVFGNWDPTLLVVFASATLSFLLLYRFFLEQSVKAPLEEMFAKKPVFEWRLITGPAIFGLGWGLGGLCPGPAVTDLMAGVPFIYYFVISMIAGMGVAKICTK